MRALCLMFPIGFLFFAAAPASAETIYPNAWDGGFTNSGSVTSASGYANAFGGINCGAARDFFSTDAWYGFLPTEIGSGASAELVVVWEAEGYTTHGDVYLDISYTTDGGTLWYGVLSQAYTGTGSFNTYEQTTTVPLLPGTLHPESIDGLEITAELEVISNCASSAGSYYGRVRIHEIYITY